MEFHNIRNPGNELMIEERTFSGFWVKTYYNDKILDDHNELITNSYSFAAAPTLIEQMAISFNVTTQCEPNAFRFTLYPVDEQATDTCDLLVVFPEMFAEYLGELISC